jgi:predicted SnoaL-like aldol condensation-catalyzing enzyme
MLTTEESKRLAAEFVDEVFNKGNLAYLDHALADDFVDQTPAPGASPDKAGTIAFFEQMAKTASDVHVEIVQVIGSGNKVALHGRYSGVDTNGFLPGAPPTGKPFTMESIDITEYNDEGQAVGHWGIQDVMGVMGQLGLLPPPPTT